MTKNFTILTLLALILFACEPNKHPEFEKTDSGLYYRFVEKNDTGRISNVGDYMRVNLKYQIGDSVIFDSYSKGKPHFLVLQQKAYEGDVQEGLAMLRNGDSAQFYVPADSFFIHTLKSRVVPGIARDGQELKVDIRLVESFSLKDFQRNNVRKAAQAKQAEPGLIKEYLKKNDFDEKAVADGIYLKRLERGEGIYPKLGDRVSVHYDITLLDGKHVYTSRNRTSPYSYTLGERHDVKGFVEALKLIKKGGKAQVVIPSNLAYGNQSSNLTIPPYSALVYTIDLIDVKPKAEVEAEMKDQVSQEELRNKKNAREGMAFMIKKASEPGIIKRSSGLLYEIIKKGNGEVPKATDRVKVHYKGFLTDGRVFDQSKGKPASFYVNRVIGGWTEVLQLMPVGSKFKVYIPNEMAYHNRPPRGSIIEPYMPLIFEIELLEIEN